MILIFDFETTGLPIWKEPSDHPAQPHVVQLAAILVDRDNVELDRMEVIVRPDGWRIPDKVVDIHGIATERAREEGIAEYDAIKRLLDLSARATIRVAHNETFDARIMRIAMHRYFGEAEADRWREAHQTVCTMKAATGMIGPKWPKLVEIHAHLFGEAHGQAHDAMADVEACRRVLFELVNRGLVALPEIAAAA
jgi:DNA polymerase III subunit epsilon